MVKSEFKKFIVLSLFFLLVLKIVPISSMITEVQAHGGKTHNVSFTALQALKKAIELFDRLIINGKLDESWESNLNRVEVNAHDNNGRNEYRVGFYRYENSPEAVYIFFSVEGKYNGSNFDGKW